MFLHFPFPFFNLIWVRSSLHKFILQCCILLLLYASTHHLILMQTIRLFRCCLWLIYCLVVYTSMPLCVHACMPLRLYASMHLCLYSSTPLLLFALKPLRLYASTPLRLHTCKIVVLYSAVSNWGGYNRHKREAQSSLESRVNCSFSRYPA